jgi:hypothetical protein
MGHVRPDELRLPPIRGLCKFRRDCAGYSVSIENVLTEHRGKTADYRKAVLLVILRQRRGVEQNKNSSKKETLHANSHQTHFVVGGGVGFSNPALNSGTGKLQLDKDHCERIRRGQFSYGSRRLIGVCFLGWVRS